jgi:GNAT superfamily N-acetyltransferase
VSDHGPLDADVDHSPRVRAAGPGDAAALDRLAALVRAHAAGERGGDVLLASDPERFEAPQATASSPEAFDAAGTLVLVGCLGDVPVGYAAVRAVPASGGPQAEVVALFVEPGARGVGVGRLLIGAATEWARRQGCRGIGSVALPGDRATKNFFEAAGMVARLISVHRPLDDPARADTPPAAGHG